MLPYENSMLPYQEILHREIVWTYENLYLKFGVQYKIYKNYLAKKHFQV